MFSNFGENGSDQSFVSLALLHCSVQSLVSDEIAEKREVLATLGTMEPLLSSVDTLVHLQIGGCGKLLPAVGAGERPLPCVDHLMALEAANLAKTFPTLRTLVRLLPCMDTLVDTQLALVGVAAGTEVAAIGEAGMLLLGVG